MICLDSRTSFHEESNSQVSYYDAALPGTQPIFNWEALLLALKAAVALDCQVQDVFSFDRKHYFYGDQPTGYQLTQYYNPYAKNGFLKVFPRDGDIGSREVLPIRIKQIQIEQDTGKSTYIDDCANIDLNRTNHGLIELVTEPDLPTPESAGAFVKKLQMLLRHLGVCSGELESGAMRVDVNVSVNGGQRCEIKNLSSTSAIVHAIKAEFKRQKQCIEKGIKVRSETRGWDGVKTWKLRSKEGTVDYRYMPDPELKPVKVTRTVLDRIADELPVLPDEIFVQLLQAPYFVPLRDARTLMNVEGLVDYYHKVYDHLKTNGSRKPQLASNWIVHRLYGEMNVLHMQFSEDIVNADALGQIILLVEKGRLTRTSASYLLKHLIINPGYSGGTENIDQLIEDLELGKAQEGSEEMQEAISSLCQQIIDSYPEIANQIKSGQKLGSIMYLVGQVMRQSQGRVDAEAAKRVLLDLLK